MPDPSVTRVDNDYGHLYPTFAAMLKEVLAETAAKTGVAWRMAEGYRSPARQLWLYASGRTRPGPIVTWMKYPVNHGSGLAADCYPNPMSEAHHLYETFRSVYTAHGAVNPAWAKGDFGHVQYGDEPLRLIATEWCQKGFQPIPPPGAAIPPRSEPVEPEVYVMVNGIELPSVPVYLDTNRCYVGLRALSGPLRIAIEQTSAGQAWIMLDHPLASDHALDLAPAPDPQEFVIPLLVQGDVGYVRASDLSDVAQVAWDADSRTVSFTTPSA